LVHAFEALGGKWALDVEGGALVGLSDEAYGALNALNDVGWDREAARASLLPEPPDEALDELIELRDAGQLDVRSGVDELIVNPPGVVKALCLHAAHDCDLRCRYCFAGQGSYNNASERARMPAHVGKAALDFLVERSGNRRNLEVDFFGGEPLLNLAAIRDIVAYGRELERTTGKKIAFTITTNAVGITDEAARWINAEMDNLVISIDGRKEVHDRMRPVADGRGSYDLSLAGGRLLVAGRYGKSYYIRGTFTAYNLDFTEDVLALADVGFGHISIEPVVSPGSEPYALTDAHIPAIFDEYDRLARTYVERRDAGRPFSFFHFNIDLDNGPCLRKRLSGCGAGNEYAAVTPDGKLYPCHQFVGRSEFEMGDVLTGELDAHMREKFARNNVLSKDDCRVCWAKYFCSGGCAANAFAMNGRIDKPYGLACELQRKRLELALAIAALGV